MWTPVPCSPMFFSGRKVSLLGEETCNNMGAEPSVLCHMLFGSDCLLCCLGQPELYLAIEWGGEILRN